MKRTFLAGLAASLLLAGGIQPSQTTTSTSAGIGQMVQEDITSKPADSKSTQPVTQAQKVYVRDVAQMDSASRFVQKPGPRRVKYGKSRWVLLS